MGSPTNGNTCNARIGVSLTWHRVRKSPRSSIDRSMRDVVKDVATVAASSTVEADIRSWMALWIVLFIYLCASKELSRNFSLRALPINIVQHNSLQNRFLHFFLTSKLPQEQPTCLSRRNSHCLFIQVLIVLQVLCNGSTIRLLGPVKLRSLC